MDPRDTVLMGWNSQEQLGLYELLGIIWKTFFFICHNFSFLGEMSWNMHSFVTLVETPTQAIGFFSINHFSNWSWVSSVSHIRVRDWCKELSNVFNYPLSTFETRCVERVWQGAYQTTTIHLRQPCCFTQLLMLSRVSTFLKIIKQWL